MTYVKNSDRYLRRISNPKNQGRDSSILRAALTVASEDLASRVYNAFHSAGQEKAF
jgi:hypothetical protein